MTGPAAVMRHERTPGVVALSYALLRMMLAPEAMLTLPRYPGSMFRGAFGHALRKVVCVTKTFDCPPCVLRDRCVFPYIFETPPPPGTSVMRKYTAAPHPFVLTPPWPGPAAIRPGEPLTLGLVLFGKALRHLPYLIFAFEHAAAGGFGAQRVRCRLASVDALSNGESWTLYSSTDGTLCAPDPFEERVHLDLGDPFERLRSETRGRITIKFRTPARLLQEERLATRLDFPLLVRSLLRRIGHLSYFHCGGDLSGVAFREWIKSAGQVRTVSEDFGWFDWERYSGRQQARMKLGGMIGSATFEGPVAPFLPLLRAGEVAHVGKGTSFGLGGYCLLVE
jgi:hypothetical protein